MAMGRKYMQNRVAHIYSLYFLLTAVTFLTYDINASYDFISLWQDYKTIDKLVIAFLNFTFLRGFFANYFFTGISQAWSLTVEEVFYLLAPHNTISMLERPKGGITLAEVDA